MFTYNVDEKKKKKKKPNNNPNVGKLLSRLFPGSAAVGNTISNVYHMLKDKTKFVHKGIKR